jgi:enoyl-CoA hydratase/carnithine racemase
LEVPVGEVLATNVADGVAVLTLNRPDARNALNVELLGRLEQALASIAADSTIRTVVFRGAGTFFCAGGDLKERAALPLQGGHDSLETRSRREGELLAAIERQPQLTLAAVDGGAVGAGLGIVCACDLAVATRTSLFQAPEVLVGAMPAQIAPLLSGCVGQRHARRLLLSGERIDADEAHRIGLVHEVVADNIDLEWAIKRRLTKLAACDPGAVRGTKMLLDRIRSPDNSYAAFAAKTYISELGNRKTPRQH